MAAGRYEQLLEQRTVIRILLIFAICLISCNQQKNNSVYSAQILDHFGLLKIGMERNQFLTMFPSSSKIKDDGFKTGYNVSTLQFNKSIILNSVYAEFENEKLVCIGTKCNKQLMTYLKDNFGQNKESINTNSKNIYCGIEQNKSNCLIGLYKKGYYHDYN